MDGAVAIGKKNCYNTANSIFPLIPFGDKNYVATS